MILINFLFYSCGRFVPVLFPIHHDQVRDREETHSGPSYDGHYVYYSLWYYDLCVWIADESVVVLFVDSVSENILQMILMINDIPLFQIDLNIDFMDIIHNLIFIVIFLYNFSL